MFGRYVYSKNNVFIDSQCCHLRTVFIKRRHECALPTPHSPNLNLTNFYFVINDLRENFHILLLVIIVMDQKKCFKTTF